MSDPPLPPRPARQRFGWIFWVLFWGVIIFGIGIAVDYSETFTNCVHERKNRKEYEALKERSGVLGGAIIMERARLRLLYVCVGDFTDKNNGAIVALATLMVGVFTFTLWRSNSRLWKASIEQTAIAKRALLDVERPHFFLENLKMHDFYFSQAAPDQSPVPSSVFPSITYDIVNRGNSPGWIVVVTMSFMATKELPSPPEYGPPIPIRRGYPIVQNDKISLTQLFGPDRELTGDQRNRVILGEIDLIVFGCIEYEDIFRALSRETHKNGFCWRYVPGLGIEPGDRFDAIGPDAYWYHT
jgi:hypothetical protein